MVSCIRKGFAAAVDLHQEWLRGKFDSFTGESDSGQRLTLALEDCQGWDFRGLDLRAAKFYGVSATGSNFANADLSYAQFEGSDLSSCDFTGTVARHARFTDVSLESSLFAAADFSEAIFEDTALLKTRSIYALLGDKPVFASPTHTSIGNDFAPNTYWRTLDGKMIALSEFSGVQLHGSLGADREWWSEWADVVLSLINKCEGCGLGLSRLAV